MNHAKELREFVLFIKLPIVKKMKIPKNTLERITRHWSHLVSGSRVIFQYILRSRSLWHPLISSMLKNKQIFSLAISKLISVFSLWLYNLVWPTIISTNASWNNNSRSLRAVTTLSILLNFSVFDRSTTLISLVSHFISKTGGFG